MNEVKWHWLNWGVSAGRELLGYSRLRWQFCQTDCCLWF